MSKKCGFQSIECALLASCHWNCLSIIDRLYQEFLGLGLDRGDSDLEHRGTSLIRKHHPVGPYSRTMPRVLGELGESRGGGRFLMGEVPL